MGGILCAGGIEKTAPNILLFWGNYSALSPDPKGRVRQRERMETLKKIFPQGTHTVVQWRCTGSYMGQGSGFCHAEYVMWEKGDLLFGNSYRSGVRLYSRLLQDKVVRVKAVRQNKK